MLFWKERKTHLKIYMESQGNLNSQTLLKNKVGDLLFSISEFTTIIETVYGTVIKVDV